ncbi:unnamed protein product [Phytophthora lilii]|uniref:Unnamed protein product n=1 Tax=Phytophthora lilii TaxID=2077276 RepID=A0A9W6U678_9STRA|nr:unnamed protein product [Phytophthora lilii]
MEFPSLVSIIQSVLNKAYSKYEELEEAKAVCQRLHERLGEFLKVLDTIDPDTFQAEDLLQRLQTLVEAFAASVDKYASQTVVDHLMGVSDFLDDIKLYNENLDNLLSLLPVRQTAVLVEWRSEFEQTSANMLTALFKLRKKTFLKLDTPPSWLIAANEVSALDESIDKDDLTEIFVEKWQGVQVAVKQFGIIGESPVFDKHFAMWRTLFHPHVAQLFGAGSKGGAPFFVYEYASQRSLDRCWNQMKHSDVWKVLHQAALGLLNLHSRHVVHGNLSCSKILVNYSGHSKLFDFGASYFRENNRSNSIKPEMREEFAAPECIGLGGDGNKSGLRHSPSFESDVYSFGLAIMEAIGTCL